MVVLSGTKITAGAHISGWRHSFLCHPCNGVDQTATMGVAGRASTQGDCLQMSRAIRSMTLALTLIVLCSSATYAFPLAGRQSSRSLFETLWDRAMAWLAPGAPETHDSMYEKAGSQMDPNGHPLTSNTLAENPGDAGSQMDPNGNK